VLVVISAIDLERRIIPNRIVLPATAIVLVAQTLLHPGAEWLLAALAAALFLFVPLLVYPAGMGMGDVKLALLLGAMLGRDVAIALMLGLIAGTAPAIVLFIRHGSAARKKAIPFGPFLAVGGVTALFVGEAILDWYLGLRG
jgi:leader peptidase (prepilin peptidase) / N-methyltransferase